MKTLLEKAMYLSRHVLRASYNGRYFHSLTLLARTDLSQQSYGSTTTAPFSYSDVTTFKSSAGVYISYTLVLQCTYIYELYTLLPLGVYNLYTPQHRGMYS